MSMPSLSVRESSLVAFFAALFLAALFGPSVPVALLAGGPLASNPPASGWPSLLEVLASLPMAAAGIGGLYWLYLHERRQDHAEDTARVPQEVVRPCANPFDCAWLFFAGLVVTAAAACFYHLQPDDLRLAANRAGVAVTLAGIVGFAVCERVSARAGWPAAWLTLAGGLLAAIACQRSGNALPWALVQSGGMALMLALSLLRPARGAVGLRLGWVILAFVVAKLFELLDHAIHAATHELLSGFSLKHLTVAVLALIVLQGLQARSGHAVRHNSSVAVTA